MNSTKSSDAQRQPKANLPHAKLKLNEKQICFVLFHISLINPSKEIKVCISSHSSHRVSNCPSHSFHCLSYSSHSFRCPCHCVSHCTHTSLISRYPSLQKYKLNGGITYSSENVRMSSRTFCGPVDMLKAADGSERPQGWTQCAYVPCWSNGSSRQCCEALWDMKQR